MLDESIDTFFNESHEVRPMICDILSNKFCLIVLLPELDLYHNNAVLALLQKQLNHALSVRLSR